MMAGQWVGWSHCICSQEADIQYRTLLNLFSLGTLTPGIMIESYIQDGSSTPAKPSGNAFTGIPRGLSLR